MPEITLKSIPLTFEQKQLQIEELRSMIEGEFKDQLISAEEEKSKNLFNEI